jgi:hypothetical protein
MMLGLLSRYFSHLQWYEEHSEFLLNPLYIAGDSYSGLIVPPLTLKIARGINFLVLLYEYCMLPIKFQKTLLDCQSLLNLHLT